MAARVTVADVKAILDNTSLEDAVITPYITSANIMVNEVMGTTEDTDILAEIERWLAAHMITITRERQAQKEGAGGAEITYSERFGVGLKSTTYGQMVLALDTTNAFASLMLKKATIDTITTEYD